MIELNLLELQGKLRFKRKEGKLYLFDTVRKKFLVQTPEEVVRQLVMLYLVEEKGYSINRISVEKSLKVNELTKRFDLLIYDENMKPLMMVECKAPSVSVSQSTFHQIAIYNLPLKVRYLLVTNGMQSYCCEMNYLDESYTFLTEVPASFDAS